jgi:hypothetical protein
MSKHTELRKHLKSLGISTHNMQNGTVEGNAAIFLHKDGNEYQFTGYTEGDIFDGIAAERDAWLVETFKSDEAAVSLGSRGGTVTTDAKAAAARLNGRKGGRPRKTA